MLAACLRAYQPHRSPACLDPCPPLPAGPPRAPRSNCLHLTPPSLPVAFTANNLASTYHAPFTHPPLTHLAGQTPHSHGLSTASWACNGDCLEFSCFNFSETEEQNRLIQKAVSLLFIAVCQQRGPGAFKNAASQQCVPENLNSSLSGSGPKTLQKCTVHKHNK